MRSRPKKRTLFKERAAIVAAAAVIGRHARPSTVRHTLCPAIDFAIPLALGKTIQHLLVQHRMVFIGGVENGNFLLVGVFQVIVEAFQAQVASATLGQGKAELQTRPLLNVW